MSLRGIRLFQGSSGAELVGSVVEDAYVLTWDEASRTFMLKPGGGAILPSSAFVYVAKAAAPGGDGSIAAPFDNLQSAADALPTGGVVLVAPGDYSAEVLTWADDVPLAWVSVGPLLNTLQGTAADPNSPLFPAFTVTASGNPAVSQSFQGLRFAGLMAFPATGNVVTCIGCAGVFVSGAQVLTVLGGQLIASNVDTATLVLQGVDIFNASIEATNFVYLLGCQSWGQAISVNFAPGPPGPTCWFDATTKGNASNQAPVVSNGVAAFSGLPTQSITGATTQQQVDSIVAALVGLGLATDDR